MKGVVTSTSDIRLASGAGSRCYTLKEGAAEIVVVPQRVAADARAVAYSSPASLSQPPGDKGLAPRLAESRHASALHR